MIRIPSQASGNWSVAHGRDLAADLVDTRNMDFEREGYAALARLPIALQTSFQSGNFGLPLAVVCDGTTYYILTSAGVWSSADGITITQLTTTNQPANIGLGSDAVIFNGQLAVSGDTEVKTYASGTWTNEVSGLSNAYPHPLAVLEGSNHLAAGDGNIVHQYDTSFSEDSTNKLTIPKEYIVTWLRYRSSKSYIGTRNISGRSARLFLWNGVGVGAQESYGVQASWIYCGEEYDSSIAVVTSAGQILRFNGGGFDEVTHFPVYELPYSWTSQSSPASAVGKVHQRGMIANGKALYINIDGSVHRQGTDYPGNFLPQQPSGLWEYNPKVGLHHKAGYNYSQYLSLTPSASPAANVLSFSSDHQALTGDAVYLKTLGNITGLTQQQTYFAIKVSETSLKLALSPADALAGRAITIAGTISGDTFCFNTYNSLGSTIDMTPGCVALFTNVSFYDFFGIEVLFGGRCQDQTDTTRSTLMALGLGRNIGSFTTAPLYSANLTETFQKVFERMRHLFLDTDQFIVKYRTTDRFGVPTPTYTNVAGKAVWVDASSFTIDSRSKDIKSALSGDEVTIVGGAAAGRTAHVTADPVVGNDGHTYTFTLDETIPLIRAGYLSEVIIDNWTKLDTVTNQAQTLDQGYAATPVYNPGSWVQFKIEYRGKNAILRNIIITSAAHQLPT